MTVSIPLKNVVIEGNTISDGYATDTVTSTAYYYTKIISTSADAKITNNTISGISNSSSNNMVDLSNCSCIITDNVFARNTSTINAYVNSSGSTDHVISNNIFDNTTVNGSDTNIVKGVTNTTIYLNNINQQQVQNNNIISPQIYSSAGRIIPSVVDGANANTTYIVGNSNNVIRVTSSVTANRAYKLSNTNAITNDTITIYCESSFNFAIDVQDDGGSTIYALGNGDFSEGPWATFIYIGGWKLFQSPASRVRQQTFIYTGATQFWPCPRGVTQITLIGWGGGGGGAGGHVGIASTTAWPRGGGGGAGAQKHVVTVTVTPNTTYSIEIGAAGTFGAAGGNGGDGGTTTFDGPDIDVISFLGGGGGKVTNETGNNAKVSTGGGWTVPQFDFIDGDSFMLIPQIGGASGSTATTAPSVGRNGGASAQYFGGAGGGNGIGHIFTGPVSIYGGGGGGGGGGGPGGVGKNGGEGGDAGPSPETGGVGLSADPGTGAGGGGGGAGGASDVSGALGGTGGYGGTGKLTIIWVK